MALQFLKGWLPTRTAAATPPSLPESNVDEAVKTAVIAVARKVFAKYKTPSDSFYPLDIRIEFKSIDVTEVFSIGLYPKDRKKAPFFDLADKIDKLVKDFAEIKSQIQPYLVRTQEGEGLFLEESQILYQHLTAKVNRAKMDAREVIKLVQEWDISFLQRISMAVLKKFLGTQLYPKLKKEISQPCALSIIHYGLNPNFNGQIMDEFNKVKLIFNQFALAIDQPIMK